MTATDTSAPRSSAGAKSDKETSSALERGISLLRCFTERHPALSYAELERATGIPRPSVVRLAATLVGQGMLRHEPGGERFTLGPGVVSLARVFLAGLDVRAVARPLMQAMADELGGSVYLAIRDGVDMVLIEACRSRSTLLSARLDVGSRTPLANSALGRACLLATGSEQRERLFDTLGMLRGPDWAAQREALEAALAAGRETGYCLSAGEFHRDINSLAVPIVDAHGEVMALNFGGPAYDFPEPRLREIASRVTGAAAELAEAIGGSLLRGQG